MGELWTRRRVLRSAAALPLIGAAACYDKRLNDEFAGMELIHAVRVFDGERVIDADSVLVNRGVITAVGRDVDVPGPIPEHDGGGGTLLPGLIDAHVHTRWEHLLVPPVFGVTTMIDMFTLAAQLPAFRRQRESTGRVAKADVWSAGTLVTAPGGHGSAMAVQIPTLAPDADPAAFVRARLDEGSDFIKIVIEDGSIIGQALPTLSAEQVRRVVAAAHDNGVLAVAHVQSAAATATAVTAGVDMLAHVPWQPLDQSLIERLRGQDIAVVATLAVVAAVACSGDAEALADDPKINPHLPDGAYSKLFTRGPHCLPEMLRNATANVRALHEAGVTVLAGTDAGNNGTTYGASLHEELDLLVRAGLTPTEALASATSLPARRFGLTDRGRIATGARADLVLVDGDPTTDITATRNITAIWKNGKPISR